MYRIRSVELRNINNIEKGKIRIHEKFGNSEIIGIYGPNGTGKSTLINVLRYIEFNILNFESGSTEYSNKYLSSIISITKGHDEGRIKLILDLISDKNGNKEFAKIGVFSYEIILSREDNLDFISNEKIRFVPSDQKSEGFQISFSKHHISRDLNGIAKVLCCEYCKYKEQYLNVIRTSVPTVFEYGSSPLSVLFRDYAHKLISAGLGNTLDNKGIYILEFFVYIGKIIFFDDSKAGFVRRLDNFVISINDNNPDDKLESEKVSKFMRCFFPDFEVDFTVNPTRCTHDGISLSIEEESYGVKKLLSLYSGLHEVMTNPESLLVIDEFDEGMFEYIIGEILKAVEKEGKGQLIFTAHNLRCLEVLDRRSITFATYDSEERFVTLKNIKKDNNLRDVYLRMLYMPGYEKRGKKLFHQSVLYNGPDTEEIAMALKRREVLK